MYVGYRDSYQVSQRIYEIIHDINNLTFLEIP